MPAPLALHEDSAGQLGAYLHAMRAAGRKTGRSTSQAARSFCAKLDRAGGWNALDADAQIDAVSKARSFVSWLLVTGQLTVTADLLGRVDLRLGNAARTHCSTAHAWFITAGQTLQLADADTALQWNALIKMTAMTGTSPERLRDSEFKRCEADIMNVYRARATPHAGRNMASILHRLRLTLFHAGSLASAVRPDTRPSISITGWVAVPTGFADAACRYVAQIDLSLRPATVEHIEHDLREFGTWLAQAHPDVDSCADLQRRHIEDYKSWVGAKHGRYTGKPLNRVSVKNRLINLHCFLERITEWGYPNPPQRPLIFTGDLPIIDKPLPRFLDDAAATKLMRASRADPDPLSRLIVELLARTGIRKSELLGLNVDAVVQIGSAFWLRIPVGKLHNDRYIPLHPQLKEMLDDWITHHRPTGLRSQRLLLERTGRSAHFASPPR